MNCKGNHFAYSRDCARWKVETRVQQLKVEALEQVSTGPSYAVVISTTKSISINADLMWCYQENKYKNIVDVEKLQRQTAKPIIQ